MNPTNAIPVWETVKESPSIDATISGNLPFEIAETKRVLEDTARREREKTEEEERQHQECQKARARFAEEEAGKNHDKAELGQEILEYLSLLRKDTVFQEAFRLCMKLNNQLGSRFRDRVTIFERNLTRPIEANLENSWLVGHRKVLDTFRLDPSLNLVFREYVPPAHMAEAMAESATPYRGERPIKEAADFTELNHETVRGLHEALRTNSVRRTLASELKERRRSLEEDQTH